MLEAGTKKFEDLEFQQLERESSLEEERETMSQQLLQERAEYHSSVAKRKVRRHHTDCVQEYPWYYIVSLILLLEAQEQTGEIFGSQAKYLLCSQVNYGQPLSTFFVLGMCQAMCVSVVLGVYLMQLT